MSNPLYSVELGNSAQTLNKILRVLFPEGQSVLDATWGKAGFWKGLGQDAAALDALYGLDIVRQPGPRASSVDVIGDYRALPFRSGAVDVTIFDPPYLTDVSKNKTSLMGNRFGAHQSDDLIKDNIQAGLIEAWRCSRLGVVVKVSQHTHESKFVDMQGWVREAAEEWWGVPLYGQVEQLRQTSKMIGSNWDAQKQLSVWCNSATFLIYKKGDQRHKRRG